jgi:anthranilate synthase component 1
MITLPQQGTWLPADTQTPISLYLTLVREKQGFLLESTEVDRRLGRYSLIGWDFRLSCPAWTAGSTCRATTRACTP